MTRSRRAIARSLCFCGFEGYFEELVDLTEPPTPETIGPIAARYGLEMKPESIPELVREHGLKFPGVE